MQRKMRITLYLGLNLGIITHKKAAIELYSCP